MSTIKGLTFTGLRSRGVEACYCDLLNLLIKVNNDHGCLQIVKNCDNSETSALVIRESEMSAMYHADCGARCHGGEKSEW